MKVIHVHCENTSSTEMNKVKIESLHYSHLSKRNFVYVLPYIFMHAQIYIYIFSVYKIEY